MVLPDLSKVQSGGAFYVDGRVSGDKMYSPSYTVNNDHNHVIAMSLRKLDNEVDTNDIPLV
jgi:hypothetical protein